MKIKFVADAVMWLDKVNGNTYHSVVVTRVSDKKQIHCEFTCGYGDHYKQTALEAMAKEGWLRGYDVENCYRYPMENNYPIHWTARYGTKKECVNHGKGKES